MRRGPVSTWGSVLLLGVLLLMACGSPQLPEDLREVRKGLRWGPGPLELGLGIEGERSLYLIQPIEEEAASLPDTVAATKEVEGLRLEPLGEDRSFTEGGRRVLARRYRIRWTRPGERSLPSLSAGDGLSTEIQDYTVTRSLPGKEIGRARVGDVHIEEAPAQPLVWPWVLGGILALALLFGWWRSRRAGGMRPLELERETTPKERALARLDELERAHEGAGLQGELLVVAVSEVLRVYLAEGMQLPSTTRTTEEFLEELRVGMAFPEGVQGFLKGYLDDCDLVKFAAQGADRELCNSLLGRTRRFLVGGFHG